MCIQVKIHTHAHKNKLTETIEVVTVHTYISTYIHIYLYLYIHIYTHVRIYTYICIYTQNFTTRGWCEGEGDREREIERERWGKNERAIKSVCVLYVCAYVCVCVCAFNLLEQSADGDDPVRHGPVIMCVT